VSKSAFIVKYMHNRLNGPFLTPFASLACNYGSKMLPNAFSTQTWLTKD
jgi:hypothetical protein